uniref:Uncharacterized protein n=1 Tax=Rhipicephalus microplus TaxID=6941 RepID=A0A6G5A4M3_RHIMP
MKRFSVFSTKVLISAHAFSATIQLPVLLMCTASSLLWREGNITVNFLANCKAETRVVDFSFFLVARCIHCSDVRRCDLNYAANAQWRSFLMKFSLSTNYVHPSSHHSSISTSVCVFVSCRSRHDSNVRS